jgi:surface protein
MSKKANYSPEKHLSGQAKALPFSTMTKLLKLAGKNICKLKCENGKRTGTGFFCNININAEHLEYTIKYTALFTNWHVLNEKDIKPGKKIYFSTNNEENKYEIEIDENRQTYTSKRYDVTIIQIKKKDNIKTDFFEIDENIYNPDYNFENKPIYLLHYPKGNEPSFSRGNIIRVEEGAPFDIGHLCDSDHGSSGGPLINEMDYKVIGIHKGAPRESEYNYNLGTLLKDPINEFKNKIIKLDNESKINDNMKEKKIEKAENEKNELIDDNEDEITIKYKIEDIEKSKNIRIFGDEFVKNNENICKIIINGNELPLTTHKDVDKNQLNNGIFEIKLKGIKNITNMRYMFSDCELLFSLPNISKLNTENVIDMSYMFYYCELLSSLADISKWKTDKVANMSFMFCGCNSLTSLPDISK